LRKTKTRIVVIALAAFLSSIAQATPSRAEDKIENAGVTLGSTVGNLLFIPLKAVSASLGAVTSALSFVVTGGDRELSRQIWNDTLRGPYVITPDLARKAIGERPELDYE
jgi:hypothetical protein